MFIRYTDNDHVVCRYRDSVNLSMQYTMLMSVCIPSPFSDSKIGVRHITEAWMPFNDQRPVFGYLVDKHFMIPNPHMTIMWLCWSHPHTHFEGKLTLVLYENVCEFEDVYVHQV